MNSTNPISVFHTPLSHPKTWGGEAPLYRASDNTLHWVDPLCETPELHILNLSSLKERVLQLEDSVTFVRFMKGTENEGKYICAYYQGVGILHEATGELEILKEIIRAGERGERRFNDGCVDSRGRMYLAEVDKPVMAMGINPLPPSNPPRGRLWRYDPDGYLQQLGTDTGFVCGNGMGWSPDDTKMYVNDSVGQKTYSYTFDLLSGTISKQEVFHDWKDGVGEPDGLTIDVEGNIWIAVYNMSRIIIFSPSGTILHTIHTTAKAMTCPTFGGEHLDELFITSARSSKADSEDGDEGGGLFRFNIPIEWELSGTMKGTFGARKVVGSSSS